MPSCTIIYPSISYSDFLLFFNNNNAYIYFTNSFSKLEFLNCARLSRSKLVDTAYKYIFIRDYLDKLVVKRGHLYYHAIKSDLIFGYKCVINNKIRDYELRPLLYLDGVDNIDLKFNPLTHSDDQLKE